MARIVNHQIGAGITTGGWLSNIEIEWLRTKQRGDRRPSAIWVLAEGDVGSVPLYEQKTPEVGTKHE